MLKHRVKYILRSILPASILRQLVASRIHVSRLRMLGQRIVDLEAQRITEACPELSMLSPRERIATWEGKVHSQNGEDGLTLAFLSRIPVHGTFFEVGIEDGRECNSAILSVNLGWRGTLVEGEKVMATRARKYYQRKAPARVEVVSSFARPDNIEELLANSGLCPDLDLLSIDVDGFDYWLWDAVRTVKPSLVIMEYNQGFGLETSFTVPYEAAFNPFKKTVSGVYFGASLLALTRLGKRKGYDLVGCDSTGTNAFFMRSDLRAATDLTVLTPTMAHNPALLTQCESSVETFFKTIKGLPLVEIPEPDASSDFPIDPVIRPVEKMAS